MAAAAPVADELGRAAPPAVDGQVNPVLFSDSGVAQTTCIAARGTERCQMSSPDTHPSRTRSPLPDTSSAWRPASAGRRGWRTATPQSIGASLDASNIRSTRWRGTRRLRSASGRAVGCPRRRSGRRRHGAVSKASGFRGVTSPLPARQDRPTPPTWTSARAHAAAQACPCRSAQGAARTDSGSTTSLAIPPNWWRTGGDTSTTPSLPSRIRKARPGTSASG